MILVDTSVWSRHFRESDPRLAEALDGILVVTHPFIIGELACGNLRNRRRILSDLQLLPSATAATDEETLTAIEKHRLSGLGIGWVDAHLIASALLTKCSLWTLDQRLQIAAKKANVKLADLE